MGHVRIYSKLYTAIFIAAIQRVCTKFHQDTFKAFRLVFVATYGQTDRPSSIKVDADSEYIYSMESDMFLVCCKLLAKIKI